jgi:hypothetical protein
MELFLKKGGTSETTVQASFTSLYTDLLKENASKSSKTIKPVIEYSKPGLFYNWLEKDGSSPVKASAPEEVLAPAPTKEKLTKEELDELGVF